MKSVGIIRKVDDLGRIVLPAELRRTLDIAEQDAMEIYVDGASVVLRKYEETCIFCGSSQDILSYREKMSVFAVFTPCSRWANSNTTEVLSGIQHIAILIFPTTQF